MRSQRCIRGARASLGSAGGFRGAGGREVVQAPQRDGQAAHYRTVTRRPGVLRLDCGYGCVPRFAARDALERQPGLPADVRRQEAIIAARVCMAAHPYSSKFHDSRSLMNPALPLNHFHHQISSIQQVHYQSSTSQKLKYR